MRLALLLVAVFLTSGCRKRIPVDEICKPPSGYGMLCLVRASSDAKIVSVEVRVDGQTVIDANNDEFFEIQVPPGEHTLRVWREGHQSPAPEDFTVADGEMAAFEIELESYGGEPAIIDLKKHRPTAARELIYDRRLPRATETPLTLPK